MIKWATQTIIGLIAVFFICYGLIWAMWEWLWLSFPVWVICYLLYRKYGIMNKDRGHLVNLPKKYL